MPKTLPQPGGDYRMRPCYRCGKKVNAPKDWADHDVWCSGECFSEHYPELRARAEAAEATIEERDAEIAQLHALLQRGIEETRGPYAPSVGLLRWRVDAMEVLGEEVQRG